MAQQYQISEADVETLLRMKRKLDNVLFVGMEGLSDEERLVIGPAAPPGGTTAQSDAQVSTGQYQGMVFQMVSQNQTGWGFVMATPLL